MDDAFEAFTAQWTPLGQSVSTRYYHLGWRTGELEQNVLLGMWNAYRKLDTTLPVEEQVTFVRLKIREAILREATQLGLLSGDGHHKDRSRETPVLDAPVDSEGETTTADLLFCPYAEIAFQSVELRDLLREPLLSLRPAQRTCVMLHIVYCMTFEEIAAARGVQAKGLYKTYARGLANLRKNWECF